MLVIMRAVLHKEVSPLFYRIMRTWRVKINLIYFVIDLINYLCRKLDPNEVLAIYIDTNHF